MSHLPKYVLPLIAILLTSLQANADVINFKFSGIGGDGLLTTNSLSNPTGGSGDATTLFYDTDTNILTMTAVWGSANGFQDLTGDVTVIHLHGPADINTNAGVAVDLTSDAGLNTSATAGGIDTTINLDATNADRLLNGLLYLNVHTASNPSGEIRGNLIAVPEPGTTALAAAGLAGLGLIRRRR